ncbi:extracellular solute-binding protein [Mesorhizobium sp. LjRoot246]|uniref:extracellular solute-binding protein n=1 Tax=Mesorhizobium sp. LjRoot246 TaxID=3342294 RepID=UPI003ECE4C12
MKQRTLAAAVAVAMFGTGAAQAADIEFWYGNTGKPEEAIQAACAAFNKSQEKDKVTCVGQGSYEVAMQKAIAAFRAGNAPALLQVFDAGTLDIMLSDAAIPLSEALPDVKWDDYITGARSYYQASDGRLFSQPYNASTLVFYTNKTLLERAGVTKTPETWEEVIDAARKLKASGVTCPYGTNAEPWIIFEQFAARHGEPIATKDNGYGGLDAEYVFNKGLIAQHMQNLKAWRDEGLVRLDVDTKAGKFVSAFTSGECAMMEGSSGSYTTALAGFGGKYELTVSLTPMYAGHERHNTLVGGGSIWLMKGHSDEENAASKAFLNFLRQPVQQLALTEATGYVPVTQSALDTVRTSGKQDQPAFKAAALGIESLNEPATPASRGIRLGFYTQFRAGWTEEVQKAFNGEQTMQQALDNAKTRGDELLKRFAATYGDAKLP